MIHPEPTSSPNGRGDGRRRGFTLVESIISVVIVGVMLAAAMATVGASAGAQKSFGDLATAGALAQELMAEILQMPYEDPTTGATIVFGRESGESGGSRNDFDDVDDYDGWSESSIRSKDGTQIAGYAGWSRSVSIQYTSSTDPTTLSATDQGVKLMTVTVFKNGDKVLTLSNVRTRTS